MPAGNRVAMVFRSSGKVASVFYAPDELAAFGQFIFTHQPRSRSRG